MHSGMCLDTRRPWWSTLTSYCHIVATWGRAVLGKIPPGEQESSQTHTTVVTRFFISDLALALTLVTG